MRVVFRPLFLYGMENKAIDLGLRLLGEYSKVWGAKSLLSLFPRAGL